MPRLSRPLSRYRRKVNGRLASNGGQGEGVGFPGGKGGGVGYLPINFSPKTNTTHRVILMVLFVVYLRFW